MKHLPYENWILDEPALNQGETAALANHIAKCSQCRQLKTGWEASKVLLKQAKIITPAPGFTGRWQANFAWKCKTEKIRRYRITMFGLLLLAFTSAMVFMIASGSFMQILANSFNSLVQAIIAFTNGLSNFGMWVTKLPAGLPLTAGFLFFGLINAFLMAAVFLFWNMKNRKKLVHETKLG